MKGRWPLLERICYVTLLKVPVPQTWTLRGSPWVTCTLAGQKTTHLDWQSLNKITPKEARRFPKEKSQRNWGDIPKKGGSDHGQQQNEQAKMSTREYERTATDLAVVFAQKANSRGWAVQEVWEMGSRERDYQMAPPIRSHVTAPYPRTHSLSHSER